jgi:lysozyme
MKPLSNETFSLWFNRLELRNFKAHELTWMFARVNEGVRNSTPPRELWPNIVPTMRILDDLRDFLEVPITPSSTYRSPAYNRSVKSGSGSQHPKFTAVDFKAKGASPRHIANVLRRWRSQGKFTGGIGLYPNFVHLDTRKTNVDW